VRSLDPAWLAEPLLATQAPAFAHWAPAPVCLRLRFAPATRNTLCPSILNVAARSPMGEAWWAFLEAYRTFCIAPGPEVRGTFEQLRSVNVINEPSEHDGF